jgi:uroporphyrinogen decarboxylase
MKSLPYIVDAGVDCIETCSPPPLGDFDIVEAKRLYGDRVCFKGGMDMVNVIQRGTPELIDRKVRELVEAGARGSGFILGTADSIRPETSKENFDAFFKAAAKYAKEFAHLTRS